MSSKRLATLSKAPVAHTTNGDLSKRPIIYFALTQSFHSIVQQNMCTDDAVDLDPRGFEEKLKHPLYMDLFAQLYLSIQLRYTNLRMIKLKCLNTFDAILSMFYLLTSRPS